MAQLTRPAHVGQVAAGGEEGLENASISPDADADLEKRGLFVSRPLVRNIISGMFDAVDAHLRALECIKSHCGSFRKRLECFSPRKLITDKKQIE